MSFPIRSTILLACAASVTSLSGCKTDPTQGKSQAQVAAPTASAREAAPSDDASLVSLPLTGASGTIAFVGAKISATHPGKFKEFSGKIGLSPGAPEKSRVEVTIAIPSLEIEPAKLRGHLLAPDFFDSEKFPTASFSSAQIKKVDDGFMVIGNLTLHGVTKLISFPAKINAGADQASVSAEFGINRKDFGIVYPGMPDDLIQDTVLIKIDLKAQKS